jgi:hypothetical protein
MGRSALNRELVSYSWCASLRLRIVVVRVEEFDEFLDESRLVDREVNLIFFRLLLHSQFCSLASMWASESGTRLTFPGNRMAFAKNSHPVQATTLCTLYSSPPQVMTRSEYSPDAHALHDR